MRGAAASDVVKVWLYAAATVVGGAWLARWLYNAGKALAEVTGAKRTNAILDALADWSRSADFPTFYRVSLVVVAVVLLLPWIEWLRLGGGSEAPRRGPWSLRLPAGARVVPAGQALRRSGLGALYLASGFLLAGGLFLLIAYGLTGAGSFIWREQPVGWSAAGNLLAVAALWACVQEYVFRGVALGIFLRAMRPAAAIGLAAVFFAAVHSALPGGLTVADAELGRPGFELLGKSLARWADPAFVAAKMLPLLALGAVLGFARWRTASLALPVGLHAGWLFAAAWFGASADPVERLGLAARLLAGGEAGTGLLVVVGLLIVATLIFQFTRGTRNVRRA